MAAKKAASSKKKSPAAKTMDKKSMKSTKGGGDGSVKFSHADESPKETVTFEYGGLAVQYK